MDKFAEMLTKLASIVGIQVERLWPRVVRIYWIEALLWALVLPLVSIVGVGLGWFMVATALSIPDIGYSWPVSKFLVFWPGLLLALLGSISAVVAVFSIPSTAAILIDPEASYVENALDGLTNKDAA